MYFELLRNDFPVHFYCLTGNSTALQSSLDSNNDVAFMLDDFHCWTPAHWAAASGNTDCLRLLQSHEAVDVPSFPSMILPIHLSSENGHFESTRVLISSGTQLNTQDNRGDTALHKAARMGHLSIVSLLLSSGAQVDITNFSQETPIQSASRAGHSRIANMITNFANLQPTQSINPLLSHNNRTQGFRNGTTNPSPHGNPRKVENHTDPIGAQ